MEGCKVSVVDNNDHLGTIVSGSDQERKNIDANIKKGRKSLFSLLGPAFSFKCSLSPQVKIKLYRTYICPITRSGLSSLVLCKNQLEQISVFQRKILKGILHLSKYAPTPSIHFLCSEIPIEGKIHKDIFSLFYSVWSNPNTKVYQIVKYLLQRSNDNSRTWSINLKHLSKMYGIEDPLSCLQRDPPNKSQYKQYISDKINIFHETELRLAAAKNSKMKYLNVSLHGLTGRLHPALGGDIRTTSDVDKMRPHLKLLSGDYLTYQVRSQQSGGSPICRLCGLADETSCHIIASCQKLDRKQFLEEYKSLCLLSENNISFDYMVKSEETLTQFILDPCSFNLKTRIHIDDPVKSALFKLSRDFCFSLDKQRRQKLNALSLSQKQ